MTVQNDKRLFLLDAMALIYRAYYAFAQMRKQRGVGMVNSKGLETSAIYGFTNTLLDLIQRDEPTHIAVVFDTFAPTQRAEAFDFYKAQRAETPDDIVRSIPYIKDIIRGFRIPVLELDGFEADDIIGTLAKHAEKDGYEVYMVTPDKDFGQLVSDKVFIYKPPYQGKGGWEKIGQEAVLERWGIERIEQVIDMLGLMGDAVDNIPGIPGVGEVTAAKLLKQFGSIDNLLDNTDQLQGKLKEKVETNRDLALISKQLATIHTDVPVPFDEEDLIMEEPDKEKLSALFNELEFRTLGKRIMGEEYVVTVAPEQGQMSLFGNEETPATQNPGGGHNIDNTKHTYTLLTTLQEVEKLVQEWVNIEEYCFDTETTHLDPLQAELVGIALSKESHTGVYIALPDHREEVLKFLDALAPLFNNKAICKIGQNLKYDIRVLAQYGVSVQPPLFDTMLAHYLYEPDLRHGMDYMAETYLGYHPVSIEELIGKKGKGQKSMRDVPVEQVKEYAAEDADITIQLKQLLGPKLAENDLEPLFNDIEMPLMPVLAAMEDEGIRLDTQFLQEFSKELAADQLQVQDTIYGLAGMPFNIDSPKQLGELLFDHLKIPYSGKKTKTGQYSTGEDILSKLAADYPIAASVLEYREIGKLKSTYVDALPQLVLPATGRVHTTYNQAVANTGRLSSTNPNLQNIPIRTERGQRVRKAFIPRDDEHVLLSADYSQIELRIIAALSQDEGMISAFRNKEDIHTATAARVFGVQPAEVDRAMRSKAKAVNFGIAYGQTAFGLSQQLNISRTEAKEIIDTYFAQFPGIQRYMDDSIRFAQQHGYARTLLGRRRQLADINAGNPTVRGFAERNAINMPIQGTAADMIKIAMVRIHRAMQQENMQSKMILQVHDELVFDAHRKEVDALRALVIREMEGALQLDVPIVVETGVGSNWLEAH